MPVVYDTIIIGAGPAGLTAALYAGRFRLNALVLEKFSVGGQIILSSTIENFPGFPGGIATGDLIDKMKAQVEELGVKIATEEALVVSSLEASNPIYNIKTSDNSYKTKTIIIATGAVSKRLGVLGEERLIGRGVSYCATCDGPLYKGKEVVVVGAGDRAIEEALFLTAYARKVTLIHRRQGFRASGILIEKAKTTPKINFILDSVIEEIKGEGKVSGIKIKNVVSAAAQDIACDGVFIFVGINPNTEFLKNQLREDDSGFIITDSSGKTSQDAIFACGDCTHKSLYQVVNACAEGAVAVDAAHKYLLTQV